LDFQHWRYGGGATDTVLHPVVLVAMLVAILVILWSPRKLSLVAFLLSTFLIPAGQDFLVGGVHIYVLRILVLVGSIRVIRTSFSRRVSLFGGGWNSIDSAFSLWVLFHVVAFALLYSDAAALVNQAGYIWDCLGGYLVLRHLIQNEQDADSAIKCFSCLAVILAICMIREQMTGQNLFGLLGGVRFESQVREGRVRSEAVFQHAILAGTFGAFSIPLFVSLWRTGKNKLLSIGGVLASAVMVITSGCSTPILSCAAGILGMCFWPLRKHMRLIRWGVLIMVLSLHVVMKAPVWALIERIDLVQGSSSYHRFQLVNQFIRHAGDWWLLGTKTNAEWGEEMIDTSNAYVEQGTGGGLLTLIFFIVLISRCFGRIGTARKAVEGQDLGKAWFYWLLGVSMFVHVAAFWGIFYFDQTRVAWFALPAMVSAATYLPLAQPVKECPSNRRNLPARLRSLSESQ
jgi:hypothetical protein